MATLSAYHLYIALFKSSRLEEESFAKLLGITTKTLGRWKANSQKSANPYSKRHRPNYLCIDKLISECVKSVYGNNQRLFVEAFLNAVHNFNFDISELQKEYLQKYSNDIESGLHFVEDIIDRAIIAPLDDKKKPVSVKDDTGCMATDESRKQTVSASIPRSFESPAENQPAFRFGKVTVSSMPKTFLDAYLQKLPTLPQKTAGFISDLMYDTCPAAFLGRDKELARLNSFACDERPLLWWAITGSAGKGKTRLAYEFLKQLSNDEQWLARTVNWRTFVSDFSETSMCLPVEATNLFLVIDYVFAYEKEIAGWIEWLSTHLTDAQKIRVLLIEREDQKIDPSGQTKRAPWEELFSTTPQDPMLMIRLKYTRENLNLNKAKLLSEDAKAIVYSYCKKKNISLAPEKIGEIVLITEKSSNGDINPLQLLLLTEYYASTDHHTVSLDLLQSALESIVAKELTTLRRLFNIEYCEQEAFDCVLLLATIVGSIDLHSELFKILALCDYDVLKKVLAKMEASQKCERRKDGAYYLRGIQPDLIGEHFVHTLFSAHSDRQVCRIVRCINRRNHYELARFLLRYIVDYGKQIIAQDRLDLFNKYLPDENTSFVATDDAGNAITCYALFTFESEVTEKNYIIYTDKTKDSDGKYQVYASVYDPITDRSELEPIETEMEWEIIEIILQEFQKAPLLYGMGLKLDELSERVDERIRAKYSDV